MSTLRADQWMILGVVALGGVAVYYLLKPKDTPSDMETPILGGNKSPGEKTPRVFPPFPQDRPRGEPVRAGQWFKGRLDLLPGRALSPTSSRGEILSALQALGLQDVEVYMNPSEAAPRILLATPLAEADGGTRWFWARTSPGVGGRALLRPSEMTYLWFATPR